ncbi:MAG TPA: hypothetical protein VGR00_09740 [Thermoanaerobaculia bacterium]|nr:hypothetical protein [Thermoanaerobaculia bacterium]
MTDETERPDEPAPGEPSAPAPPSEIKLPPLPPRLEVDDKSGCMKWGLVGCAGLSVLLIVGLMVLGSKAGSMMDWAIHRLTDQVVAVASPAVTPQDREAYHAAVEGFVERSRQGKVDTERMAAFRKKTVDAVADGTVTPEEIHALTAQLQELSK